MVRRHRTSGDETRHSWWRFGSFSAIGFPYLILTMFFTPLAELTAFVLALVYIIQGHLLGVLFAFLSLIAIETVLSAIAIYLDEDDWRLILCTPLYVLVYRYVTDVIRLKSYWDLFRGKMEWSRAERVGELPTKIEIR